MRKTNAYYATERRDETHVIVKKLDPDLMEMHRYTVTTLEGGGQMCSCVARTPKCRHIQIAEKFMLLIGKHAPYDFDNARFAEAAPSYLSEA